MIRTLQKLLSERELWPSVFGGETLQSLDNEIAFIRYHVRKSLDRPLVEEDKAKISLRSNSASPDSSYIIYYENTPIRKTTWEEASAFDEKTVVDNATASMTLEDWARQQEFMEGRVFERPRNTGKNQQFNLSRWIDATTEMLTIDLLEKHLGRKPLLADFVKVIVEKKRANVGDIPEIVLVNYDKKFIGRIIFEKIDEMGYGAKMETAEEAYKALRSDYTADAHAARSKAMNELQRLRSRVTQGEEQKPVMITDIYDTDVIREQTKAADHLADAFAYAVQALHNHIPFWVNLEAEQRKDKRWQRIFAALLIANIILWWPLIFGL